MRRIRGPQAFAAYLSHPQATAEMLDTEGWVHTGDLGTFDAAGYLYVTDRIKELIKVNAYQVPTAELEALLLSHPAITDAAVIGRPDERAGERPVAYVAMAGDADTSQIPAWAAERVAEHKRLAAVIRVDAIPKTPSGKILRRRLKDIDSTAQAQN